jgi:hypothetical protein
MASITYDKTTNGKHRVRWQDGSGEHEKLCDTHFEAQQLANEEMRWKMNRFSSLSGQSPEEEPKA